MASNVHLTLCMSKESCCLELAIKNDYSQEDTVNVSEVIVVENKRHVSADPGYYPGSYTNEIFYLERRTPIRLVF